MARGALSAATATQEFDLTRLAETTDKQAGPRTPLLWVTMAFGVVIGAVGIFVLIRGFGPGQVKTEATGILVVVLGVATTFVSGSSLRGLGALHFRAQTPTQTPSK